MDKADNKIKSAGFPNIATREKFLDDVRRYLDRLEKDRFYAKYIKVERLYGGKQAYNCLLDGRLPDAVDEMSQSIGKKLVDVHELRLCYEGDE